MGNTWFVVGNSCRVRFWTDNGRGEVLLASCFPQLYSIVTNKDALASDFLLLTERDIVLEPSFLRLFNIDYYTRLRFFSGSPFIKLKVQGG